MQPVKLTIYGDFWDSQIYKGRLYLWDMDKVLHVYDWEPLIESIAEEGLRLPLVCAFSRGDLLYVSRDLSIVFDDKDLRKVLEEKFHRVSQLNWSFRQPDIGGFLMGQQDSPFDTLHDDSSVYMNCLYGLTDTGLYSAEAHEPKNRKHKVDRAADKLWDVLGTALKTKSGTLAVAAADDGLFELPVLDHGEPRQISTHHTVFLNWAFASICGSSDLDSGPPAGYTWTNVDANATEADFEFNDPWELSVTKRVRELVGLVSEAEIFGDTNQNANGDRQPSWGGQDKLYRSTATGIEVVRFTQRYLVADPRSAKKPFETIGKIDPVNAGLGAFGSAIAGSVTLFGVIIEYESALVACTSDDEQHVIFGPITRWRVFPQSVRYENHLHVIFDDRIKIWSFNNDYFVNQRKKTAGAQFRKFRSRRTR